MLLLLLCAVLEMASVVYGANGAMMNMATITDLDVTCDQSGMTVSIDFSQPFNGIIFSKGHYSDSSCRYVEENSARDSYRIWIPSGACGSQMNQKVGDVTKTELTNTIVVQNDKYIQEIWDTARKINCEWIDNYVKTVNFNPFSVGMLQAQEVNFQGERPVECWMDLQLGKYPDTSDINSIVKIGDPLSLLVYIKDNNGMYDVAVKDCYAFGGPNYNDPNIPRLQLTDEEGCVLKDKLISSFYSAREDDLTGSTLVTYAHVNAFKFPDAMDVFMTCNVEICKGDCDTKCSAGIPTTTTEAPRRYGSTLFGEPIYTTKPTTTTTPKPKCYPGSPDPSCKTGKQLYPTVVTVPKPKCYPGSLDPNCPPVCTEGSTDPRCPQPTTPAPCVPGSLDPNCQYTTEKDRRYGSILFPATITTTPSTTTTQKTTPFTVPYRPTTPRKKGGAIFSQPRVTPAPKLKPKPTTTKAPKRGKQVFSEPKPKPEPSGDEWEGEPRYHAFHSYHYQRGDGRRSRRFGQRINPRTKRVIRSVTGDEPARPLEAKVPLKLTRSFHVVPPPDYPLTAVEIVENDFYGHQMCLSPVTVMSFTVAFGLLLITTFVFMYLFFVRRKSKGVEACSRM